MFRGHNYSTSWLTWDLTLAGEKGVVQFCFDVAVALAVDRQIIFCLVSCCKLLLVCCYAAAAAVALHQTALAGLLIWRCTVKQQLECGYYLKSQSLKAQAVADSCMVKVRLTLKWQLNCCCCCWL